MQMALRFRMLLLGAVSVFASCVGSSDAGALRAARREEVRKCLSGLVDTGEVSQIVVSFDGKKSVLLIPAEVKRCCGIEEGGDESGCDYNILSLLAEYALDGVHDCAEGTSDDDLTSSIGVRILQKIAASDGGDYARFLLAMYALQLKHGLEGPARGKALPHEVDGNDGSHPLVIIHTAAVKEGLIEAIAYLRKLSSQLRDTERGGWIAWSDLDTSDVGKDLYEREVAVYLASYRS